MKDHAAQLREAFDRSFASASAVDAGATEGLLAITVGGDRYVVRLAEISRVLVNRKVAWLPSAVPELIGIAGLKGAVLPVYDLAMLIGLPRASNPRWLMVAAAAPVGFAFDRFDGYESVRPDDFTLDAAGAPGRHVRELLRRREPRPVVHVAAMLETIRNRRDRQRPA